MELRTLHDRVVRPQLRTVPGVTEVNAFGGLVRQAQVDRPARAARRASASRCTTSSRPSRRTTRSPPAATSSTATSSTSSAGWGRPRPLDDLRRTVIRAERARRAGAHRRRGRRRATAPSCGRAPCRATARGEVVSGIVMMLRGENSREVVRRVRERVEEINRSLPAGVAVAPYYDQTDLVAGRSAPCARTCSRAASSSSPSCCSSSATCARRCSWRRRSRSRCCSPFLGMRWLGLSANLMSLGRHRLRHDRRRRGGDGRALRARRCTTTRRRGELPDARADSRARLIAAGARGRRARSRSAC